jgi:hypothetical protein
MTVVAGLTDADVQASHRRDVCQFADDRLAPEQKLRFVHQLLQRDAAEVRMFLDRLEQYSTTLDATLRHSEAVAKALDEIAADRAARARYLEFMRDADEPSVQARMIALAERLGWLTPAEKHAELVRMLESRLAHGNVGSADVDLVCTLNGAHALDGMLASLTVQSSWLTDAGHAGVLACLGSPAARERVLQAMTSPSDADVEIAQVYLRHRPIADVDELRRVASGVARMRSTEAQVRALDTLASHRLDDRQSLEALTQVFPLTRSLDVQRAIAGILIRADYHAFAKPELVRTLRQHRLKSSTGQDLFDVLIRRLQSDLAAAA